ESDLTFRLASGLVIWQPMWEHRQPEVSAFNALVKPIRNIITAKRSSLTNNQSVTCESPNLDSGHTEGLQVVCETTLPDSVPPKPTISACHRGNSLEGSVSSQTSQERGTPHPRVSMVIPPCQKSRYATYFDVAVLRCLLQPHWSEEGTQWSLMYYLQRLRHMLQEKPEKPPEPEITPLPRLRSSSMVAAAPSLVNTHKTQVSSYHRYETSGVVLGSGGQRASEKHSFGVGKTAQRSDMCIDSEGVLENDEGFEGGI
ncbi:hypothetical protein CIB84_009923, partial [Bambusicola thoracicus]